LLFYVVRFLSFFALVSLLASLQAPAEPVREVPLQYRDGFLWLKVCAAGQREPLNFLLDSGASSSVLNSQTARGLNLKLGARQSVHGVHSQALAYWVTGSRAEVAGIGLPKSLLSVDLSALSKTCHQPIDGLLGADFLRGRIVQIDFAARKIRFLNNAQPTDRCAVLPIKWRNDAMCVPVGIAGNSPQWMRLDTGCESALEWTSDETKGHRNHGTQDTSIGLAGASIRYIEADVQLGNHSLSGVRIGVHEQRIFPGESGLLGNGVLSQFQVTIDTPNRRVILQKN
jgi:gag-polyprotein putative aspartyl protease